MVALIEPVDPARSGDADRTMTKADTQAWVGQTLTHSLVPEPKRWAHNPNQASPVTRKRMVSGDS